MIIKILIKKKIYTIMFVVCIFFSGQKTYSNSDSYESRILNPNPDVVYMTGDISSVISIDIYEITLEQHQQIRNQKSKIQEIILDDIKPCLSNLDYSEIRLAYYPKKFKRLSFVESTVLTG